MKRIILSIIVAGIWGLCFCASPAQAEPITIAIEAVVDRVDDPSSYLGGKIKTGDIIAGTYTYDSSTLDSNPSPSVGDYQHFDPPAGIFLSVGGFDFQTDPANVYFLIEVANDHPWFDPDINKDNYLLISYNNLPLSNDTLVDDISWQLDDRSGQALSNTSLPLTAPVLGDWQDGNSLRVEGVPRQTDFFIDAHVISAIPEPGTLILLSLGGLLLRFRTKS